MARGAASEKRFGQPSPRPMAAGSFLEKANSWVGLYTARLGRDPLSRTASQVKRHLTNAQQPQFRQCILYVTHSAPSPTHGARWSVALAPTRAPVEGDSHASLLTVLDAVASELAYVEFPRLDGLCDYRTRRIRSPSGWRPDAPVSVLGARASPRASRPRHGARQAAEGGRGRGRRFCSGRH
jgi:hypothetical protein